MAKTGSKSPTFDVKQFENFGSIGATYEDMAGHYGVCTKTIQRQMAKTEFKDAYQKGSSKLHSSLRTKQISMALAGNVTMLIWLGKQLLGQKDKSEVENIIPPEKPKAVKRIIVKPGAKK